MTGSPRDVLLDRAVAWFSEHGVLDTSMRTLAAGIGTSNRMLNYHFGSRDQLLAAVVTRVCEGERTALATLFDAYPDPMEGGRHYWTHITQVADTFAPMFFELSAHAMYGKGYARELRGILTDVWLEGFTAGFARVTDDARARQLARLSLAVGRGLLFDLALTGDRAAADATIAEYVALIEQSLTSGR